MDCTNKCFHKILLPSTYISFAHNFNIKKIKKSTCPKILYRPLLRDRFKYANIKQMNEQWIPLEARWSF